MHRGWLSLGLAGALLGGVIAFGACANGGSGSSPGEGNGDSGGQPPSNDGSPTDDVSGDSGCGNTATNPQNCGMCGHMCNAGALCSQGMCGTTCMSPEVQCGGDGGQPFFDAGVADGGVEEGGGGSPDAGPYCANLSNDTSNCGECGKSCGPNHTCTAGMCVLMCPQGTVACVSANFCIPPGTCCTSSDCDAGGVCESPGGMCGCSTTDMYGTACTSASALSAIAVGGSTSVTGSIDTVGGANWFAVTFTGNTNQSFHPHITLSTNPNNEFIFDVSSDCTGTMELCGTEGGNCTAKTQWETSYSAAAISMGDLTSPALIPIPVTVVYLRVYRVAGMPLTCDQFTVTLSN
jgi:hypothetical protein